MTPLDLAQNLAKSPHSEDRALAVAMLARGLADDDPSSLRQGWPMEEALPAAAKFLQLDPADADLIDRARMLAPTVSDAMLNRKGSR